MTAVLHRLDMAEPGEQVDVPELLEGPGLHQVGAGAAILFRQRLHGLEKFVDGAFLRLFIYSQLARLVYQILVRPDG